MEAAVVERLRRNPEITFHPELVHAPLIYDKNGRIELEKIFREYISLAQEWDLPIFLCTPTWRTNHSRVSDSGVNEKINIDAVHFLQSIRDSFGEYAAYIKIGGLIGCKNDCYLPEQALETDIASEFHAWQIDQLVQGGADFLIAETLPALKEAIGIAKAMEKTGLPYFISFVINKYGTLLDGNKLVDAIETIDQFTENKATGYMVNCAYPSFLCPEKQDSRLFQRLVGYLANASSLDHEELENSVELHSEPIAAWGSKMLDLNRKFKIKVLGGCCGTDSEHLKYICENRSI